jgi:hypothetical protein
MQLVKCGEQFYVYDCDAFNELLGLMQMLKHSDTKFFLICHPEAKLEELLTSFSKQNGLKFTNRTHE